MAAQTGSGGGIRRVRRPKDKEELLSTLVSDGPFSDLRDVLTFAAALGWHERRREPFEASGETIRWDTMVNRRGTEALIAMLAARETDDPNVLADERFDERLRVFEEYANGGLSVLEGRLAKTARSPQDEILELVNRVLRESEAPPDDLDLAELSNELSI